MANTRSFSRSFGGGEISPEMLGRIDDTKNQTGLALCSNFVVKPQGPVENRAGFRFVRAVKDSTKMTRLLPFTFSTTQTMVLEMGEKYFRFHTHGATLLDPVTSEPYEITTPYLEDDLFDIHHVQSADILTLVHPAYPPMELRRLGAHHWELTEISFLPSVEAPATVTAVASGHTNPGKYDYEYVVTSVGDDLITESPPSASATARGNVYETGGIVTISWTVVPEASRYNVYKLMGGVYGSIGQTDQLKIVDDNIAPDLSVTPPRYDDVFNGQGDYPGAVSYFEQRRCFAGTINRPSNIWMTRSGTESNMSFSLPIRDDDRIAFRVANREANTIRHIIPLTQLVLLTSAAEWRVTSVNSDAITPTTISVAPQSYIGSNNIQPVIVNTNLIYCAARGGHVRECAYNWQAGGLVTGDLSLRSAHLFDTFTITDMSFSKAPLPLVWFVSSTGILLGLTYIPEQGIGAWHQHSTINGLFEACTCVAEGEEDVLYVVVKRHINGEDVRYIERLDTRIFPRQKDAFFVDSGLTYDGTNTTGTTITITGGISWANPETLTLTASGLLFRGDADIGDAIVMTDGDGTSYRLIIEEVLSSTAAVASPDRTLPEALRDVPVLAWSFARDAISGLHHLEGQEVNILADGAVHAPQVVENGAITLDREASIVHAGIPIHGEIQTLPLALQVDYAFGQGRPKNINKVWLRVFKSSGIWVGPDPGKLTEIKQRTDELYGLPPVLKTEEIEIMIAPSWQDGGVIHVKQEDPLPVTVSALTVEVSLGG